LCSMRPGHRGVRFEHHHRYTKERLSREVFHRTKIVFPADPPGRTAGGLDSPFVSAELCSRRVLVEFAYKISRGRLH
jgi:hypothetical protein